MPIITPCICASCIGYKFAKRHWGLLCVVHIPLVREIDEKFQRIWVLARPVLFLLDLEKPKAMGC